MPVLFEIITGCLGSVFSVSVFAARDDCSDDDCSDDACSFASPLTPSASEAEATATLETNFLRSIVSPSPNPLRESMIVHDRLCVGFGCPDPLDGIVERDAEPERRVKVIRLTRGAEGALQSRRWQRPRIAANRHLPVDRIFWFCLRSVG